ncbi:macro domain-containing protein [Acetobacterium sp. KB-1]|jgi:O-acetyl-ADP-ribose deacetylase (regulator of RNase III)|uniref:macro domain-containing protein n=1 Tax=Acetobacterium sp. KB-1 TaxID=2184575 RepID=UPI0019551346|nr:macro domain-containing protein [Acetobacterium sp. KB-1]
MPFEIIRNDITKMMVDIIVNAANTGLKMGGGVCGAIFAAAGADQLQAECDRIGGCAVGEAVITDGYRLPAKRIIHTVGPVWQSGGANEARLLHRAYTSSLRLALKQDCKTIAFPLISSGIYGYPKDQALKIAVTAIAEFLREHEMLVYLVVFDKKAFVVNDVVCEMRASNPHTS